VPKITPFLWFDDQAEEAMRFYASVFKNSKIHNVTRYGEGAPGPAGRVMTVNAQIAGQEVVALNGGPQFPFTEAFSFVVDCEDQEEVDQYWSKLTANGGEESQCGWLRDRYGLSWQIVPRALTQMLGDKDPKKSQRVMEAMLQMKKIDVPTLKRAYERA
jgi:predicted 3-demethylubiquinone-9 3-methyltransferase (glyoxalase superfamily)